MYEDFIKVRFVLSFVIWIRCELLGRRVRGILGKGKKLKKGCIRYG